VLRDGEVHVEADHDVRRDGSLVLRAAAAAARAGTRIDRQSLDRLAAEAPRLDGPWPPGARQALVELLATGHAAIPVLETIDQRRLVERVLPEWSHTRLEAQRNAIHRYTVDRHLCEAAANAAALADAVGRPDLLLIGAWLHDIGKGLPGDHTEVGMELLAGIAARMGYGPDDVTVLVDLVRHHLLLPDVATRRDLADDDVIHGVATPSAPSRRSSSWPRSPRPTRSPPGPSAWGPVEGGARSAELVGRVAHVLAGGGDGDVRGETFPYPRVARPLAGRSRSCGARGPAHPCVDAGRPGSSAEVAARSPSPTSRARSRCGRATPATGEAMAASRFKVASRGERSTGRRWLADVRRRSRPVGVDGPPCAGAPRLRGATPRCAVAGGATAVRVDNDASATATVVEVRALDGIGVLYRITRALADLDLDITVAKVSTLGNEVVDAFYVRTPGGAKLTEPDHIRELERAVLHQLSLA
jgi:[protein-PII] uridylyltransferase